MVILNLSGLEGTYLGIETARLGGNGVYVGSGTSESALGIFRTQSSLNCAWRSMIHKKPYQAWDTQYKHGGKVDRLSSPAAYVCRILSAPSS